MANKYDILVYDVDEEGRPTPPERLTGVMAENAKALVNLYKSCGQTIKIEREYKDEESNNYGKLNIKDGEVFSPSSGQLGVGGLMTSSTLTPEMKKVLMDTQETLNNPQVSTNNQQTQTQKQTVNVVKNEPPKFFTVGGIKCKLENGKMYQKQWMRLSDEEMNEIRIVADKSNKICPLKDKHVEVLKWVLSEDKTEDDSETGSDKGGLILG